MDLTWIAEILFFGGYFISWIVGAFNPLTVTSASHLWIVITAISALVVAILLLIGNGRTYFNKHPL